MARRFEATAVYVRDFLLWFSRGKTSLLPEPEEFTKDNQRPTTCLNTLYKWYTSCLLVDASHHLMRYGLMQGDQRGLNRTVLALSTTYLLTAWCVRMHKEAIEMSVEQVARQSLESHTTRF